jgi:hypothetical protein
MVDAPSRFGPRESPTETGSIATACGWRHWGASPKERGGPDRACHVGNLGVLTITFGAWLYPEHAAEPHSLEIELVGLEK